MSNSILPHIFNKHIKGVKKLRKKWKAWFTPTSHTNDFFRFLNAHALVTNLKRFTYLEIINTSVNNFLRISVCKYCIHRKVRNKLRNPFIKYTLWILRRRRINYTFILRDTHAISPRKVKSCVIIAISLLRSFRPVWGAARLLFALFITAVYNFLYSLDYLSSVGEFYL